MKRPAAWLMLSTLALGPAVVGCGPDRDVKAAPAATTTAAAPATSAAPGAAALPGAGTVVQVDALDNVFKAPTITIAAGTTVHFVNRGRNDHNVLPETAAAWGVQAAAFHPGDEYDVTFDEPGTTNYFCSLHGLIKDGKPLGMAGTIEVTG